MNTRKRVGLALTWVGMTVLLWPLDLWRYAVVVTVMWVLIYREASR